MPVLLADAIKKTMAEAGRSDTGKLLREERDRQWEIDQAGEAKSAERIAQQAALDHVRLGREALPASVGGILSPDFKIQAAYDLAHPGNEGANPSTRPLTEAEIQQQVFHEDAAYGPGGGGGTGPGVGIGSVSQTAGNIIPS